MPYQTYLMLFNHCNMPSIESTIGDEECGKTELLPTTSAKTRTVANSHEVDDGRLILLIPDRTGGFPGAKTVHIENENTGWLAQTKAVEETSAAVLMKNLGKSVELSLIRVNPASQEKCEKGNFMFDMKPDPE